MTALTSIDPTQAQPLPSASSTLSRAQKAAMIVQILSQYDTRISLGGLDASLQLKLADLVQQNGVIRKDTVQSVVHEFVNELEAIGLAAPNTTPAALDLLDGMLTPKVVAKLRLENGKKNLGDPWSMVTSQSDATLTRLIMNESVEAAAVLMHKLSNKRAAHLLETIEGDRARLIVLAMLELDGLSITAAHRIGLCLAEHIYEGPKSAITKPMHKRLGDILSQAEDHTRDSILSNIASVDEHLAVKVQNNIFTFQEIPHRVAVQDVNTICTTLPMELIVDAFKSANESGLRHVVTFMFEHMSTRLSDKIKEYLKYAPTASAQSQQNALSAFVQAIQDMDKSQAITLLPPP